jgi:uroporphyrin-III C-methyltransferase
MGKVYLVGAGPGDPELLTVKAARVLALADIVLHDSLVSSEVLAKVSPSASIIDVGKRCGRKLLTQDEINSLLVSYAASNEVVVRLKGGDPLIFGRAGEELEALRNAGVEFEVVPGITAAIGAAAAAGISLTDRRVASQILFSTFSRRPEGHAMDWGAVTPATTLVLYMPGPDYVEVSERLCDAGLPSELPCVIVSNKFAGPTLQNSRMKKSYPRRHSSSSGVLRANRYRKSARPFGVRNQRLRCGPRSIPMLSKGQRLDRELLFFKLWTSQGEKRMSTDEKTAAIAKRRGLSLDGWAVLLAFLAALLVRAGIFRHVPW